MLFDPVKFIEEVKPQLEQIVDGKAVAAVSGGVDSTTAAALAYRLLGNKVIPIMIDTGFLRENEAEKVKAMVSDLMPLQVVNVSEKFLSELEGKDDAEEKRKKFRELFYNTLSELVKKYQAKYLIQGTIAADWVETQGGIKTQHNVLVQLGIDTEKTWGFKVVEPLADLYKNEVRDLARYLGLPREIYNRQPFPGPGLLVRVVGGVSREKLEIVRKATSIVEKYLEQEDYSQYFAVIFDSHSNYDPEISKEVGCDVYTYTAKATGVKGDVRAYGRIAKVDCDYKDYERLRRVMEKVTSSDITHVVTKVADGYNEGKYSIGIRAVLTQDFMTADFAKIDWGLLGKISNEILSISKNIKEVVYDITTKPPATIEFE
ncbi:ATP-binding protein [Stygiolobus caldivivus]|uniref:GMP synthase [glutamine-hydrolyzing] subunit B n=1 Tax=Stygiolobus caldivivus TaxID=2824673 RepID=A0A8D5U515_9CREN|nr:ATP-binding protein [Stygiolobus caldivivus]BCU69393.1 GMP synthase [Stygiolobus caldivivus]